MSRFAFHSASVVVPDRVAAILERRLGLDDLRVEVRGQDPEVDAVLADWHAIAVRYRSALVPPQGNTPCAGGGTGRTLELGTGEVASLGGVTQRAVRLAVERGRLRARRHGTRLVFERDDVATWLTTRRRSA